MKWERVITVFLTAAVALFAIFVLYHMIWWQPKPDRDSWVEKKLFVQNMSALPYNGIDLSQEQGYVDWQSVSMDRLIDFVYLKATEGSTHVDSRYMANVTAAYNYGFLIGSYHRFTSDSSVEKQFFNFNKNVEHSAQRLLPMVELNEASVRGWSMQQVQDSLALFAWLVNDFYGSLPMIKTTKDFYETRLVPRFEDYPLFIVDESESQPMVKAEHFYIWRRITQGTIPGIVYDVSLDSFTYGTTLRDLFL